MQAGQVIDLFNNFARQGFRVWASGGWAVDVLVGHETRPHQDLDIAVDAALLASIMQYLGEQTFVVTTDWLPVRAEMTAADGRRLDLHPVVFAADGSGRQAGFGDDSFYYAADGFIVGALDGVAIPCLSAQQQITFRAGYTLRDVDHHDLRLLHELAAG